MLVYILQSREIIGYNRLVCNCKTYLNYVIPSNLACTMNTYCFFRILHQSLPKLLGENLLLSSFMPLGGGTATQTC